MVQMDSTLHIMLAIWATGSISQEPLPRLTSMLVEASALLQSLSQETIATMALVSPQEAKFFLLFLAVRGKEPFLRTTPS